MFYAWFYDKKILMLRSEESEGYRAVPVHDILRRVNSAFSNRKCRRTRPEYRSLHVTFHDDYKVIATLPIVNTNVLRVEPDDAKCVKLYYNVITLQRRRHENDNNLYLY